MTQEQVGELTGYIKAPRIANWEQGTSSPKIKEAIALAKVLRVTASWLLCIDEESTLTEREKALLDNYRHSDDRGKDIINSTALRMRNRCISTVKRRLISE